MNLDDYDEFEKDLDKITRRKKSAISHHFAQVNYLVSRYCGHGRLYDGKFKTVAILVRLRRQDGKIVCYDLPFVNTSHCKNKLWVEFLKNAREKFGWWTSPINVASQFIAINYPIEQIVNLGIEFQPPKKMRLVNNLHKRYYKLFLATPENFIDAQPSFGANFGLAAKVVEDLQDWGLLSRTPTRTYIEHPDSWPGF
jgi:hypothetical protein